MAMTRQTAAEQLQRELDEALATRAETLMVGAHGVILPPLVSEVGIGIGPPFTAASLPFRLFVGGPLGSGRQRFTWIHVDDAVGLYDLAIRDGSIVGPLNMVAPDVPTQRELGRAIGAAMHRPAILPVPALVLRLVLWRQADIVLHGRVALPARALAAGYEFRHPTVESAVRDGLARR